MSNIIGRFYFKKTENGNLFGEYSNNLSTNNTPECALLTSMNNNFIGTYKTNWVDESQVSHSGSINIYPKIIGEKVVPNIFKIDWVEDNIETSKLYGEGFIIDGILIGDYRNFELKEIDNNYK